MTMPAGVENRSLDSTLGVNNQYFGTPFLNFDTIDSAFTLPSAQGSTSLLYFMLSFSNACLQQWCSEKGFVHCKTLFSVSWIILLTQPGQMIPQAWTTHQQTWISLYEISMLNTTSTDRSSGSSNRRRIPLKDWITNIYMFCQKLQGHNPNQSESITTKSHTHTHTHTNTHAHTRTHTQIHVYIKLCTYILHKKCS